MKSCPQCDVAVVNAICVEGHMSPHSAPAEKVHSAAFAHHLNGFFPCVSHAYCFDCDVNTASLRSECPCLPDGFSDASGLNHMRCTQSARRFDLAIVLDHRNRLASGERS